MSRFEPCTEFWSVLKVKWEQFNGGVGSSPWGAFLTTTTFLGHSLRILPIRAYQRLQGLHQQGCVKCQYESIIMRKGWQSRDGNVRLPRRSISSLLSLICWFWENCQFHFNENIRSNELKVFHFFWSNFAPMHFRWWCNWIELQSSMDMVRRRNRWGLWGLKQRKNFGCRPDHSLNSQSLTLNVLTSVSQFVRNGH